MRTCIVRSVVSLISLVASLKVAPYCFLKLEKMQASTSKSVHGYVDIYRKRMKLTLCVE